MQCFCKVRWYPVPWLTASHLWIDILSSVCLAGRGIFSDWCSHIYIALIVPLLSINLGHSFHFYPCYYFSLLPVVPYVYVRS